MCSNSRIQPFIRIKKELWEKSLYDPTRKRCNFLYIYKGKSAAFETLLDSKLHIKMAKIHAVKKSEPNSCAAVNSNSCD